MKFPKLLIPFLVVVLPTIHFANNEATENKNKSKSKEENISNTDSKSNDLLLRAYNDSERFLRFAKHTSHSSHRSHTSHKSGQHTSHSSGSNCNGCNFNIDEEFNNASVKTRLVANR